MRNGWLGLTIALAMCAQARAELSKGLDPMHIATANAEWNAADRDGRKAMIVTASAAYSLSVGCRLRLSPEADARIEVFNELTSGDAELLAFWDEGAAGVDAAFTQSGGEDACRQFLSKPEFDKLFER